MKIEIGYRYGKPCGVAYSAETDEEEKLLEQLYNVKPRISVALEIAPPGKRTARFKRKHAVVHWEMTFRGQKSNYGPFCGVRRAPTSFIAIRKADVTCQRCKKLMRLHGHLKVGQ